MMTTVYFICACFAVGRGRARREHRRRVQRGAFSTQRNFLATCIRQRQCFGLLRGAVEALRPAVVLAVITEAPRVASTRGATTRGIGMLATLLAAVPVATIVSSAHDERHPTPRAAQLVNGNVGVQGSGATARNLAVDQDRGTYGSSKARLWVYDRRLELLTRAFTLFGAPRSSGRRSRRATSQHVVPWSPVILVELVPSVTGADTHQLSNRWQRASEIALTSPRVEVLRAA
jgi:hypothetical protein